MGFRYRLMQFMQGRYGVDTTFFVLFGISCVLAFVNVFVRQWWLQMMVYLPEALAVLRVLSRNREARQRENAVVTGWVYRLADWLKTQRERRQDPFYVYRTCPFCRAVLRLPRTKGKHQTKCPKCGKSFSVWVHSDGSTTRRR